jgi:hypothetical protein
MCENKHLYSLYHYILKVNLPLVVCQLFGSLGGLLLLPLWSTGRRVLGRVSRGFIFSCSGHTDVVGYGGYKRQTRVEGREG